MRSVLGNLWDDISSSLWFIPALMVAGAIALSYVLVLVDQTLLPNLGERAPVVFGGTPDGAREILSVIAGSLATVVAVAFTVTLVAVQQAASQYSPRLLRNFTSDRGNQLVLGTYIATFAYALLVMRQVRGGNGTEEFVPALSLLAGIVLALISLGMLIYFIHHIVQSLQVTSIVNAVRREMESEIESIFPAPLGRPVTDNPTFETLVNDPAYHGGPYETAITSLKQGYLRRLNEKRLTEMAHGAIRLVVVNPRIGEYIPRGAEMARVWSNSPLTDEQTKAVRHAFITSANRTLSQDPLYGVRQVADIAIKALSPGVNDPTTAEECVDHLGDVVGDLAQRDLPSPLRLADHDTYIIVHTPSFEDFVDASFSQVRRSGEGNVHVTLHLLRTLKKVAGRVSSPPRAEPIRTQVTEVLAALERTQMGDADKRSVERDAASVLEVLRHQVGAERETSNARLIG